MRVKKAPRDTSKLSGKPLSETIEPSPILHSIRNGDGGEGEEWTTSKDLVEDNLPFTPGVIDNLTLFLLANPNRMSSNLFRADILFDSLGVISTPEDKERLFDGVSAVSGGGGDGSDVQMVSARDVTGFELKRRVVRRLIPRNPKLDRPLEQSCHFYESAIGAGDESGKRFLVVYTPHIASKEDLPWYHPLLQSWALLYDYKPATESTEEGTGQLSLHFLLYPDEPIPNRLERTLHALINTQIRLARGTNSFSMVPQGGIYKPNKDNVIPQHLVQNTYLRLKLKYASGLCQKWVEDTEPSKHVFEDLAITAFLIELWRGMYGVVPEEERKGSDKERGGKEFPGFVDVACGNGVLVYVLLMEGYRGWGFDARRRKTWHVLPESIQERLREEVYIPKPFADVLSDPAVDLGTKMHTGIFPKDTFIISNHADELTVWTPLMAALANPQSPLPFLAIPCCSHSLSGARFRYPPPKSDKGKADTPDPEEEQNPQPASGNLNALRTGKLDAQTDGGINKSMYGSLTAKTMSIAEEVGYEVEKTMLRIPSTRNMGVVGGRRQTTLVWKHSTGKSRAQAPDRREIGHFDAGNLGDMMVVQVSEVARRECAREGGVEAAARVWMDRARGIHQGRGGSQKH